MSASDLIQIDFKIILVAAIYGVLVVRGINPCDIGPCGPGQHWDEPSRSCVPCEDGLTFMDQIGHRCEACSRCKTLEDHERQTSKCNITHNLQSECLEGYRRRDDVCKKVMESTSAGSKDADQVTTANGALESVTTRRKTDDRQWTHVTTSAAKSGEQSTMQESSFTPGVTAAVTLSVLIILIGSSIWCYRLGLCATVRKKFVKYCV
ncbi:uncharacterized protein LOC131937052 [Physella acuta]|uniref:uncharacterized protein LOC131937052 n=1 Tax=Physella acuta TaxID=109671 RepID=UPI0027DC38BD|nr:uncharacterized protein LOC131937052 [Physella acuta]